MPGSRMVACVVIALALTACGGPVRDRDALVNALLNASDGDVIDVGAGEYTGTFRVPAGVTLQGVSGEARPVIVAGSGIALRVTPGESTPSVIREIDVRASGVGIAATGAGELVLDGIALTSQTGVAIVAEGLDAVTVRDVVVAGPVTLDNIDTLTGAVDASLTAIAGLVLSDVESAALECVAVRGFAGFGAALMRSTGTWTGGCVEGNAGTSILLEGSTFEINDGTCSACDDDTSLRIGDGLKGTDVASDLIVPFGLVASSESSVVSRGVVVEDMPGLGVVHSDSSGDHRGIKLRRNDGAGLWAQGAGSHVRLCEDAEVSANRGGGVVVIDANTIELDAVSVTETVAVNRPLGELGMIRLGDGLHVKGASGVVSLTQVSFSGNERTGVLLAQGDAAAAPLVTMTGVSIVVDDDDAFGCVAQDGMAVEDMWDVELDATVAARDANAPLLDTAVRMSGFPTMGSASEVGVVEGGLLGDDGLCESHVDPDGTLVSSGGC